jgi:hypothetical protein
MDDVVNRLARELADAIGEAVSEDPNVEACREKARAAGYEMRVSLEAVVGFGSTSETLDKVETETVSDEDRGHPIEITANDRRFLRSLRIATDEIGQRVE